MCYTPVYAPSAACPSAGVRSVNASMATRVMSTRFASTLGTARIRACCRPLQSAPGAPQRSRASLLRAHAAAAEAPPRDDVITSDPDNNVTDNIYSKIGVNLHLRPNHPLDIIRSTIYQYFDEQNADSFRKFDDLHPVVSTHANFDSVLVPGDHVSRSPNDTYYVDKDTVLRCAPRCQRWHMQTRRPALGTPLSECGAQCTHR
jgi:phenylalanyl-tRNA synthetase alpha chain